MSTRHTEIEQQALNELEKAKEEAYKERRHEAALQDGLNEEERARALNMPFITDAKFADRAVVRTIGVVQGSTVRAKGLPSELSNDVAALPGAELVSFTAATSKHGCKVRLSVWKRVRVLPM